MVENTSSSRGTMWGPIKKIGGIALAVAAIGGLGYKFIFNQVEEEHQRRQDRVVKLSDGGNLQGAYDEMARQKRLRKDIDDETLESFNDQWNLQFDHLEEKISSANPESIACSTVESYSDKINVLYKTQTGAGGSITPVPTRLTSLGESLDYMTWVCEISDDWAESPDVKKIEGKVKELSSKGYIFPDQEEFDRAVGILDTGLIEQVDIQLSSFETRAYDVDEVKELDDELVELNSLIAKIGGQQKLISKVAQKQNLDYTVLADSAIQGLHDTVLITHAQKHWHIVVALSEGDNIPKTVGGLTTFEAQYLTNLEGVTDAPTQDTVDSLKAKVCADGMSQLSDAYKENGVMRNGRINTVDYAAVAGIVKKSKKATISLIESLDGVCDDDSLETYRSKLHEFDESLARMEVAGALVDAHESRDDPKAFNDALEEARSATQSLDEIEGTSNSYQRRLDAKISLAQKKNPHMEIKQCIIEYDTLSAAIADNNSYLDEDKVTEVNDAYKKCRKMKGGWGDKSRLIKAQKTFTYNVQVAYVDDALQQLEDFAEQHGEHPTLPKTRSGVDPQTSDTYDLGALKDEDRKEIGDLYNAAKKELKRLRPYKNTRWKKYREIKRAAASCYAALGDQASYVHVQKGGFRVDLVWAIRFYDQARKLDSQYNAAYHEHRKVLKDL